MKKDKQPKELFVQVYYTSVLLFVCFLLLSMDGIEVGCCLSSKVYTTTKLYSQLTSTTAIQQIPYELICHIYFDCGMFECSNVCWSFKDETKNETTLFLVSIFISIFFYVWHCTIRIKGHSVAMSYVECIVPMALFCYELVSGFILGSLRNL